MNVVIIDYGSGNIASVKHALTRIGVEAILTNNPEHILRADKVIFPGVGRAKSAMQKLKIHGLDKVIPALKQPVLGICLGMQLMCQHSQEDDTKCLGIMNIQVNKFKPTQAAERVPHIGWSPIHITNNSTALKYEETSYLYFIHSYYAEVNKHTVATANYIHPFSAVIQKDNFLGVQFHPEKSSQAGEEILQNFIAL